MNERLSLDDVRSIAEEYVRDTIADESPYFDIVWNHIRHPLARPQAPVEDKPSSWWRKFLPSGLALERTRITALTPVVILTLEAVAMEMGGRILIPKREDLQETIKRCALTFGASSAKAAVISDGLADRLAAFLCHRYRTADNIIGATEENNNKPFRIWLSDRSGIPLPVKDGDAADLSRIMQSKNNYDILIHSRQVYVKQYGKQSVHVPLEGVMINLLAVLIRYKMQDVTTRELYEAAWRSSEGSTGDLPAGYGEKDVLANNLRSPLSKMRKHIRLGSFSIKNSRSYGYRCEGDFTFCLALPSADAQATQVARLEKR